MKQGFIFIPVLIIVAVLVVAGGGYYFLNNKQLNISSEEPTPTIALEISPSPTLIPTNTPTPIPTKRPFTPTPKLTLAPTGTPCSQFKPENGLTSITISLKEKEGKPLIGDWVVKIKPSGSCPGILPPNWGSQLSEVVRQPNYTYTSPGMHPGQFRVDVQYHNSGEGLDWDGTSGSHSREVVVSN